jgi:hypothetical protein
MTPPITAARCSCDWVAMGPVNTQPKYAAQPAVAPAAAETIKYQSDFIGALGSSRRGRSRRAETRMSDSVGRDGAIRWALAA